MTRSAASLFSIKKFTGTRLRMPLLFIISSLIAKINLRRRINKAMSWKARKRKNEISQTF
jgi:hypothetical protein